MGVPVLLWGPQDMVFEPDGMRYTERFERGKVTRAFKCEGESNDHGLYVRFKPDDTIFETVEFDGTLDSKLLIFSLYLFDKEGNVLCVIDLDTVIQPPLRSPAKINKKREDFFEVYNHIITCLLLYKQPYVLSIYYAISGK